MAFLLAVPSGLARTHDSVISITSGPSGETTSRDATFTFAPAAGVIVGYTTCLLDTGSEQRCSSPVTYTGLDIGPHRFLVRAYSSRGGLQGSDARSWTIVGLPPPPPPPPTGLEAKLSVPSQVQPGGLATIDASSSTGAIASISFDLDGNGSYETKCGSASQAGAVYGKPGQHAVGVLVTSPTGETSVAKASVAVAGPAAPTPPGTRALPANVTTGGCAAPGSTPTMTFVLLLICPKTVILGVAEAVAKSGCFKRTLIEKPEPRELFIGSKAAYAGINGITVRPDGASASVTLDVTIERIYMFDKAKASLAIFLESPFVIVETSSLYLDWDVSAPSVVGTFPGSGYSDKFLGLTVPAFSTPISFTANRRAQIPIALALPYPFKEVASGKLTLETDNTQGPLITSFKVAFGNVPLGIFEVKDVKLTYTRQGKDDVWSGTLILVFPPPGSEFIAKGSLGLRNGNFDNASASFERPTPGYGPLGCCVWMTKFGGTLNTSSIEATATLTAGPAVAGKALVSLDGSVKVSLLTFLIQGKGKISIVGIPVAGGSVTLTGNGVYFIGSIDRSFAGVLEANATVVGGLYTSGFWYAGGSGGLCIVTPAKDFCAGGGVALSSKGIAGCVKVVVSVGAVVYWNGGWDIFWSCSMGTLKSKVGAVSSYRAVAAAGSGTAAIELPLRPGLSRALIRLTGAGDAPRVRVEGPDGTSFEAPGPEGDYSETARRFVLRLPEKRTTDIVLIRPAGGVWRITPLPGSPQVVSVQQAEGLPDRIVRGSLAGAGRERTLRFTASLDKGQRVSFVERGAGIEHVLGRSGAAKGRISFDVADGPAGARRIDAIVETGGIAIRTETLARFRAPGPLVLPAPKLVTKRTGRGVSARWSAVPGAVTYRVRVSLGDGRILSALRTRQQRSFTVPGVDARTSAVVSVWARSASYRDGRVGRKRVAPTPSLSIGVVPSARQLVRAGSLVATCVPAADGRCAVELRVGNRVVGQGAATGGYGRAVKVRARLIAAAAGKIRPGVVLRITASVPGEGTKALRVRLR